MSGYIPLLMFMSLICILLIGYPVAFSLAATGLVFALIGISMGAFDFALLQGLSDRLFGIMSNETLLAIPFFTFMGLILERSGMAEDLLDSLGELFGKVRGGLAYSVIFVGALLAATTGVVSASVIAMGLISLPIMMRYGYSPRISAGVIVASGTLAQIIPPSLVLIVLGDQLGVSIGAMYQGALLPGLVLTGLYMLFILFLSVAYPNTVPALPPDAQRRRGLALYTNAFITIVPPIVLIGLVLGTVFMGIATPTEGGAIGAVGAMLLAKIKGNLKWTLVDQALNSTVKLTTFVIFIMIGSTFFSLVFAGHNGNIWVESLLGNLPGGALGFVIAVNILVFFLAFFLDFFEIALILVPLLVPVAIGLDINLVWFGVILAMNMQTSFMHPPFGFALFYLRSVAPKTIKTTDIYRGALPFLGLQILMVIILIAFPKLIYAPKAEKFEGSAADIEFQLENSDESFEMNDFSIDIPDSN